MHRFMRAGEDARILPFHENPCGTRRRFAGDGQIWPAQSRLARIHRSAWPWRWMKSGAFVTGRQRSAAAKVNAAGGLERLISTTTCDPFDFTWSEALRMNDRRLLFYTDVSDTGSIAQNNQSTFEASWSSDTIGYYRCPVHRRIAHCRTEGMGIEQHWLSFDGSKNLSRAPSE